MAAIQKFLEDEQYFDNLRRQENQAPSIRINPAPGGLEESSIGHRDPLTRTDDVLRNCSAYFFGR